MAKLPFQSKKDMIFGILALAAALVLLIALVLWVASCSAPENPDSTQPSSTAPSTDPSEPELLKNPYDSGDFGYSDGFLTCKSGKAVLGVDVSSHQGTIDWQKVSQDGMEFAMVRLGYRGWGNGKMEADTMAKTNLQGAKNAGLQVGAYFYSQAVTVEEALEEAEFVLDMLDGMALSMPVVFDWEIFSQDGRTSNVDAATAQACAVAFCQAIRQAGYEPMVYFNLDIGKHKFDLLSLQQQGIGFWLALYEDMTYPYRVDMWQYTQGGKVKGIEGNVDINLYFTYA